MNKLYFDIETEGLPVEEISKLMPTEWPTGNLKDPAKIEAAIAEKKAEWLDRAALKAITGRVIAVTFAEDALAPTVKTGSEVDLLRHFKDRTHTAISLGAKIYSWNGAGFDLPFICQRGAVHYMDIHGRLLSNWKGRYSWNENFVDAMQVWIASYGGDKTGSSLDTVSKALGMAGKIGSGKDFARLLREEPEKAIQYATEDVSKLREICERMGI